MATQRTDADKKLLNTAHEFSELLISHKYEEAWTKAGELNALLKNREGLTLPPYMVDMLATHLKNYYYQNNVISKAHKSMTAIGHKITEFK